ncbi:collagen-like protein [Clostridium beijerinckii]|uniref:collagen-like protein n=1 Tax=Clostridium beijerinckii TaxID=1520 RepID=UPI00080A2C32|nr:collagen-like protein [Clostridium beijerinckii]OCB00390.1 hypothetical protein BGS1_15730 [Clostridium beijerinckii]
MPSLNKVRVQLLDASSGSVLQEVDVLTSADAVTFADGQTFQQKLDSGSLKGAQGPQGVQGPAGDPFTIAKTYSSISAMNSVYSTDGVKQGQFVVIDTGNVNDTDNAKLYIKGTTAYTYLTDLSGAQGIQGPQGIQGIQGPKGDTGATGSVGTTGAKGADGATWLLGSGTPTTQGKIGDFYLNTSNFDVYSKATGSWGLTGNIKGATGSQGTKGDTGATGAQGPAGADGASVKFGTTYATGTDVKLFLKTM